MLLRKWIKKTRLAIVRSLSRRYEKPLPEASDGEKMLVEELKISFQQLPLLESNNGSPSEQEWMGNVNRLKELVLHDDPRDFLRWDVILRTMCVTHASYVKHELNDLKNRPDWQTRWRKAIAETHVGHPIPYWRCPESSENIIHHAYHIAQFEDKIGIPIHQMRLVFEFGGGYGSMCRLIHQLGFKGKYIILDLPAFSELQRFFLKSIGIAVHTVESFRETTSGTVCISEHEDLRKVLSAQRDGKGAMFIATWSISEVPIELRKIVLPAVSDFDGFLIAYQDRFNEIDNIDAFRKWREEQQGVEWDDWKLKHLPNHNRYLVGKRSGL